MTPLPPVFPQSGSLSPLEREERGVKLRERVKRTDQANCPAPRDRADIPALIARYNSGRLAKLIPLKMGRMAASPFAFFRGAAPLMAADLAPLPVTGLNVQLCGDAHVCNLGAFAAPDGRLVFDINDFDETIPGPWEWDLKRLAASVILAGRVAGDSDAVCRDAVHRLAAQYRNSLRRFGLMKAVELAKFEIRRGSCTGVVKDLLLKAERVTPEKTLKKLTVPSGGEWPKFHGEPPVLERVPENVRNEVLASLAAYRETLGAGRQLTFDAYHPCDVAFKVVGTGSVGTRDYVALMFGASLDDPLFLQIKEERPSCYAPYLRPQPACDHEGKRVAQGQQRMQTASDPFLGWTTLGGAGFLVRQLSDHKASIDPMELKGEALAEYANVCGEALAKSHARTGDALAIAGYCGDSDKLDLAVAAFAVTYADQTARDYAVFMKAIKSGEIKSEPVPHP